MPHAGHPFADDLMAQFDGDGNAGGMKHPCGMSGSSNQMDLSSLFGDSEEESEAEEESIFAYA